MDSNNDKFKLNYDPDISGGAAQWNYCPSCGSTLRNGYCRRCEADWEQADELETDPNDPYNKQDNYMNRDVGPKSSPRSNKNRNKRNNW